jgi:hypothetical protein
LKSKKLRARCKSLNSLRLSSPKKRLAKGVFYISTQLFVQKTRATKSLWHPLMPIAPTNLSPIALGLHLAFDALTRTHKCNQNHSCSGRFLGLKLQKQHQKHNAKQGL